MREHLIKKGYKKEDIINDGNTFLLANGLLGYRGTLEEYQKEELVSLNVVGLYDQYKDKWRESINLPNPFFIKCFVNDDEISNLNKEPLNHELDLDLTHATLKRHTVFKELEISSIKFVSHHNINLLMLKYKIKAKEDINNLRIRYGTDLDIYEINGPHFINKNIEESNDVLFFKGISNEGKEIHLTSNYLVKTNKEYKKTYSNGVYELSLSLKKDEEVEIIVSSSYEDDNHNYSFDEELKNHQNIFNKKYNDAHVEIVGDERADLAMRFSIYQLLSAGDEKNCNGIPARGCSGQTYKGAIFWDSEIFLVPFFELTNKVVARNSLVYRIKTLNGAKSKAKEFNYKGAFYAWESQDSGLEACSKYNVTDPKTNEPIRTYFNEKQIHISADIVYAFDKYVELTKDYQILKEGGLDVVAECAIFFKSYAKKIGDRYHLLDVIGPDEYHERVDDNAFTNYMAHHAAKVAIKYISDESINPNHKYYDYLDELNDFYNNIYLPIPNNGVIEQFNNYFSLEDVSLKELRTRITDPKEYWGGENGIASKTQIIKQADVCALMMLLDDQFDEKTKKANFDYYYPKTEHGSSLSSGAYARLASRIGKINEAYEMFIKSAEIDIVGSNKLFAGGIYIGGTHIASSGGAYLSLVYGFLGLNIKDGKITLSPSLPSNFKEITCNITVLDKKYQIKATKNNYEIKERH